MMTNPLRVRRACAVRACLFYCIGSVSFWFSAPAFSAELSSSAAAVDYIRIDEIFSKHCLDCHASQEPEAKLVLENFDGLMRGGESGPAVVSGRSGESLLVKMVEGAVERGGKRKIMPPGKRSKLSAEEIALIKAWVDGGAKGPAVGAVVARQELVLPKVTPKVAPRQPVHALAYSAVGRLLAIARDGEIELISAETRMPVRTLKQHGAVNALAFSKDGKSLFAAGGDAGISGGAWQWEVQTGSVVRKFQGHKDALYAIALSPDAKILATGSYDQKTKLWNAVTGAELKTLSGHNGAIFGLAFRPDGQILASASADRTVKLWDVSTGERRDTLSQSLKELYAVAFSPDGKRLLAAGADNRIRIWSVSEKALETTNPLLESHFAHEGTVLGIAFSSDGKLLLSCASDRTVKLWDPASMSERFSLEAQPDWPTALTFGSEDKALVVGRLDGSLQYYSAQDGKVLPPPAPELARLEPRGLQRGQTAKVKLIGARLAGLKEIKFSDGRLKGEPVPTENAEAKEGWATITAAPALPRGAYEVWVTNRNGESGKAKLFIDDWPQVYVERHSQRTVHQKLDVFPVSVWSTHERAGDVDEFTFHAQGGQSLVFDVAAQTLGSKAEPILTLSDAQGKVLASNSRFERSKDPLLFYTFPDDGEYRLRVGELVLAGSADHFYRLSTGSFPYVTGCFPLSVPAHRKSEVELLGYNLPPACKLTVEAGEPGELTLPLDAEKFRNRREFKLIVADWPELLESEPNDTPAQANSITPPCAVAGRIWKAPGSLDADLFRFEAKAGQKWVIETLAAQRGSPVDTKIEVLHADGTPVERLLLEAVRDSSVTFRGIDSDTTDCRVVNWEEMELNEFLYLQGEVVKLFRAPQGPDSGFLFYSSHEKRQCFFDTSPAGHAVDEPCYTVQPHPPGTKLASKGLPVFPVYYVNDDDGDRKLGTDSSLHFTAPADGAYLIRVTDSRGFSGGDFVYRLVVRPAAPDFQVKLSPQDLKVNAGSGQTFSINAERIDGFDGAIEVSIGHLPRGFSVSTPLVIEAGHSEASGTLHADSEAPAATAADWAKLEVTAVATVDGQFSVKAGNNFGTVMLAEAPKLFVALEPDPSQSKDAVQVATATAAGSPGRPLEITIAPGQTVPALLKVRRNGYDDLITFTVENLPHGVIVDNIGLNGVLIPKDQNERQIFITAAKWVPETDRLCFAVESQVGRQTSLPVLLHVRHGGAGAIARQ
jgi:hypothetical protein